jgi:large subunit ribosomal protein L10e
MRHNALEAARVAANKKLETDVGAKNYLFQVRVYPHHVMRENAQASGAGADRVQQGMRKSYGKPVGRAARVQANQKVMSVYADTTGDEDTVLKTVKKALKMATLKLPGEIRIIVERKAKAS